MTVKGLHQEGKGQEALETLNRAITPTSKGENIMTIQSNAPATADKNYSDEQENMIREFAAANGGTVTHDKADYLADKLGKDVRSVRAKASRMGLYTPKPKTNKAGGKVEGKEEIAAELSEIVGFDVASVAKGAKEEIRKLRDWALAKAHAEEVKAA